MRRLSLLLALPLIAWTPLVRAQNGGASTSAACDDENKYLAKFLDAELEGLRVGEKTHSHFDLPASEAVGRDSFSVVKGYKISTCERRADGSAVVTVYFETVGVLSTASTDGGPVFVPGASNDSAGIDVAKTGKKFTILNLRSVDVHASIETALRILQKLGKTKAKRSDSVYQSAIRKAEQDIRSAIP